MFYIVRRFSDFGIPPAVRLHQAKESWVIRDGWLAAMRACGLYFVRDTHMKYVAAAL